MPLSNAILDPYLLNAGTPGGFNPLSLAPSGLWDATDGSKRYQDSALTTLAGIGDPLGGIKDATGNAAHALQATSGSRPYCRSVLGAVSAYNIGAFTLTATFGGSLGSNCTIGIAYPNGGIQILQGQTVGTTYQFKVPFTCAVIYPNAITGANLINLRAYLYTKSGVTEVRVMPHKQALGQSLSIGGGLSGQSPMVVDTTVHTANFKMLTTAGGVQPYGPRPHLDTNPTNTDQPIDMSKVSGAIEGLHEAAIVGGTSDGLGETQWTGFAAQYMNTNTSPQTYLVDSHGRGSATYGAYGSATPTVGFDLFPTDSGLYAHVSNGQTIQTLFRNAAEALGNVYMLESVIVIHGEADANRGTSRATYTANLLDWQASYLLHSHDATLRAALPMYISQMSDLQYTGVTAIPLAQMDAHSVASCRYITGPKYHLPYISTGVHLIAASYRQLGEEMGKVARRVEREGVQWTPLSPKSATRVGNVVNVPCYVPVAPLVIDTSICSNPGNYGVTVTDGACTVSSVAVNANGTSLDVTLSGSPAGGTINFACTQTGTRSGPTTGARTCIRDSDTEVGVLSGATLRNYMAISQVTYT